MNLKRFTTSPNVIVPMADLLDKELKKIKFKEGFTTKDITSDGGTSRVYSAVLFRLMELIVMDVIAGDIVYFNKRVGSRFYVDFKPAGTEIINGEGVTEDMGFPLVDLRVTRYRMPIIVFDPGYKTSSPCTCIVPKYLYAMLIEEVNKGRKYPKGTKEFWYNKK
jgi:hypothetical protein